MKSSLKIIAIKTIIKSVFGLCTLPLLAVIVQYIDSVTGFSRGQGYYTDSSTYIFASPLICILIILCVNILVSVVYLIYAHVRENNTKVKK